MNIPKETVEQFAFEFWSDGRAEGLSQHEYIAQRAAEWALSQPVSMEPVAWRDKHNKFDLYVSNINQLDAEPLYTAAQLAAARQQGAEEERKKHCACQWDGDDNRTHTCVRHQGWLDVIEEWSSRAKDAEKCEDAYAKRIAELEAASDFDHAEYKRLRGELEQKNAVLREALTKVSDWAMAYPLSMFPEPDFKKAHEVLTANGMTLDSISASNMRHVIVQVQGIVDAAIQAAEVKP